MENLAATLYCSNTRCQAPNPLSNKFCQQCRTPLLRRYLWAIGQGIDTYKPGEILADRYLVVGQRVLLETKPGNPPETPLEIPVGIAPYLRLSPYGLHIPQVYGSLTLGEGRRASQTWLLESAPLSTGSPLMGREAANTEGQLLPELSNAWKDAAAMRQLNWLWQMANLWEPLSSEGVASSLLSPTLLRVEGSLVRLLELQPDPKQTPSLKQLGQMWLQALPGPSAATLSFFQQLCNQLVEGQIGTSQELIALLDRALKDCGRSQARTYQIFTATDKGPSRDHNEDACYPPSGQSLRPASGSGNALAIVCDGIGGHEGGEVASSLAISVLQERVGKLQSNPDHYEPTTLTEELELAVCAANDAISEQNDSERRSDRQRMGTTLVMARTVAHEIYITNVGDSRGYWITRHNCHQVTLDDDLASREVRLGYALYRNAVQQPTSGSLVQALGMASSTTLHPTVQRFVLDEDGVFLLCSDGLSDNDRVDQFWQTEILPILDGRVDLTTAGGRLIQIANTQNGHDNATVALLHCKVTHSQDTGQTALSLPHQEAISPPIPSAGLTAVGAAPSRMKTQQLTPDHSKRSPGGLLLGIVFLLPLSGVLAYLLIPGMNGWVDPLIKQVAANFSPTPESTPASSSPPQSPVSSPSGVESLEAAAVIQVSRATAKSTEEKTVQLLLRRGLPPQNQFVVGAIGVGSVLQVISKSLGPQQEAWLQLRVCDPGASKVSTPQAKPATTPGARPQKSSAQSPVASTPKPASVTYRQVEQGEGGWIKEADILSSVEPNFTPTAAQRRECVTPTASPATSPTPKATPSS